MDNEVKIPLPGVVKMLKKFDHDAEISALNEDWKFSETHPDGFTVHYAMQDGKIVAWGTQHDLGDYLELCKLKREAEANDPKYLSKMAIQKWILPPIIKFDLEARGFPVMEMLQTNDTYELDVIIERDYPLLKTTNLILTKYKGKKR